MAAFTTSSPSKERNHMSEDRHGEDPFAQIEELLSSLFGEQTAADNRQ